MNFRNHSRPTILGIGLLLLAVVAPAFSAPIVDKEDLTAEQIIAKHLDSIGTAEARAGITSRVVLGKAVSIMRLGGSGQVEGAGVLASQGTSSLFGITFNLADYPFERIGFDGKNLRVAEVTPGNPSLLGRFFLKHEMPFREGLLAGTLSTAWPLLDLTSKKVSLKLEGTKKIDGKKVYVLRYETKNDSGLKTKLYFDAETFQHVRTDYEQRAMQQMATEPGRTQKQGDSITKLVEDFSDFKTENGVTLPHSYRLQLSVENLTERYLQDWQFVLAQFEVNRKLEAKEFDVRTKR